MSVETGVLVAKDGTPIMWHVPEGRTAGSLPDSKGLWKAIWTHRDNVLGFAHSHPGRGAPGPSHEDLTTFEAVEAALGRRLKWWICTENDFIELNWHDETQSYWGSELEDDEMPQWLGRLRWLSYNDKQGG